MSSLSAFLLNYYAPPPKLRISLKVIVGLFVLCDCPITLAILDMEALRAGKEAIIRVPQERESRPKGCVRPPPHPKMIGFSSVVSFFCCKERRCTRSTIISSPLLFTYSHFFEYAKSQASVPTSLSRKLF